MPPPFCPTTTNSPPRPSGFAPVAQQLHRGSRQKVALDVALKVGTVKEGVNVTAAAEILHTTDASVGEVVEPKSIQELRSTAAC